ncbi:MAG: leucine-rich repeat protein, partial [Bacteroidaceae bacterium]|nr:leucine-rich repeat protein [Bacteroidaceae bacterium]
TSIGNSAFSGCTGLTEVAIGNSVTSIGNSAFNGCTGLTEVAIGNSVTSIGSFAFNNCTGLKSVSIPEGVTSIGSGVFSYCTGLTEVAIGNSVTSIGESVFQCCYQLQKVTIGSSVAEIGYNTFLECPILSIECLATVPPKLPGADFGKDVCIFVPSGCGAAYRAAEYWSEYNIIDINPANAVEVTVSKPGYLAVDVDNQGIALKNVTILKVHGKINLTDFSVMRNNMTSCYSIDLSDAECDEIPADAFSNKIALKSVLLPTQCKVIGNRAFAGCTLLSDSIAFPEGLESIGYEAFMDCNMAQDVVLPNSVESIGQSAFSNCKKIKSVTLPESLETIANSTFYGCSNLSHVSLPTSLKTIEGNAFASCLALGNVTFPATLELIDNNAFTGCSNMTLVDLSGCEKLTTIGGSAFESCSNITTLNLPASLQYVYGSAFADCRALANISLYATTPPEASDDVFKHVDNYSCLLSYPTASHVDYLISAHWGAFIETRKSIDVEVEDSECEDCKSDKGCRKPHRGGHIWYDRDWHKHHGKHHAPRRYAAAENEEIVEISGIDATIGDGLSLRVP